MKLVVVQLSDIHIKTSSDVILRRGKEIAIAIKNVAPTADAYLLAITGDVAYSGTKDQYALAAEFVIALIDELKTIGKPVFEFVIPGNHDADFSQQLDSREALLQYVRKNLDKIDPSGEIVRQILSVQKNFFEFEALLIRTAERPTNERIAYSYNFVVAGHTVRARCFNTAWVSTNPEYPGTLVFPCNLIAGDLEAADIEIAAFHHPRNWMTPDNSRAFKIAVESSVDLIMTGHEHEMSTYQKRDMDTGSTQHVEGAVLQESDSARSAFNIIAIDHQSEKYEVYVCPWAHDRYAPASTGEYPFIRNKLARKGIFHNNNTYLKFLSDPGLPILHPRKHEVTIDDLFVYPALASKDPDRKYRLMRVIESRSVLEFILGKPYVVIVGDETSGKTCLAKKLYTDLQTYGSLVPVMLNGRDIDGLRERDIRRLLRKAVEEQYEAGSVERFFDLDIARRVIITDDWHELRYSAKGRGEVLQHLKTYAGKVICLTSRIHALEELADTGPTQKMFGDFEFCDIKEFGKWATGQLIQKWHLLGQEEKLDPGDFHYAVSCSEDKVSAVIRKGILPTYPLFIISLLQADASPSSSASQNAGAYGHVLELLITDRLAQVSTAAADIGTMYTYISRIAYFLFQKERAFLSTKEMSAVHSEYCTAYKMKLPEAGILSNLRKAKIIYKEGDTYRFVYKGIYCYGVARYFFENISHINNLRPELDQMVDRLAWEDYTNIVMFYLYLSKDPQTIERLLDNSTKIYAECEPATLDGDVEFVNQLIKGSAPQKLLLPTADISLNREEYRKRQDVIESEDDALSGPAPDKKVPYASGLHELVKITIALQTLRVMGQVLRNFPGVLKAGPKLQLAEASYLLGLRILRRVLNLAENHLLELRTGFAEIFKERHPLVTQEELAQSADQNVIWLTGAGAYGVIKRISRSVGLQDLELTFEDVRSKLGEMTSVKLIDLAIHLEYFRDAPKAEMYDLEGDLRKNHFSYKLLRDLVSEFLYLRNTDKLLSQQMGDLFDIESSSPAFQLNKSVGVQRTSGE